MYFPPASSCHATSSVAETVCASAVPAAAVLSLPSAAALADAVAGAGVEAEKPLGVHALAVAFSSIGLPVLGSMICSADFLRGGGGDGALTPGAVAPAPPLAAPGAAYLVIGGFECRGGTML